MGKRGPKKIRRTEFHVAIRATAVRAAHAAFPSMRISELAAALHLSRHMVKHYLAGGDIKSADNRPPVWAEDLFAACRALSNSKYPGRAAFLFSRLAQRLAQEAAALDEPGKIRVQPVPTEPCIPQIDGALPHPRPLHIRLVAPAEQSSMAQSPERRAHTPGTT